MRAEREQGTQVHLSTDTQWSETNVLSDLETAVTDRHVTAACSIRWLQSRLPVLDSLLKQPLFRNFLCTTAQTQHNQPSAHPWCCWVLQTSNKMWQQKGSPAKHPHPHDSTNAHTALKPGQHTEGKVWDGVTSQAERSRDIRTPATQIQHTYAALGTVLCRGPQQCVHNSVSTAQCMQSMRVTPTAKHDCSAGLQEPKSLVWLPKECQILPGHETTIKQ